MAKKAMSAKAVKAAKVTKAKSGYHIMPDGKVMSDKAMKNTAKGKKEKY
jgi:hypothetical protein